MSIIHRSAFTYIGRRDYVHSTDLFAEFQAISETVLEPRYRPRQMTSFRIFREIHHGGHWWFATDRTKPEKPAASIAFMCEGGDRAMLHFYDDGPEVGEHRPEDPVDFEAVDRSENFSGSARITRCADSAALFQALVAINKALHDRTLKETGETTDGFRFIFMENLTLDAKGSNALPWDISVQFLNARSDGDVRYTLTALDLGLDHPPTKLCFSY